MVGGVDHKVIPTGHQDYPHPQVLEKMHKRFRGEDDNAINILIIAERDGGHFPFDKQVDFCTWECSYHILHQGRNEQGIAQPVVGSADKDLLNVIMRYEFSFLLAGEAYVLRKTPDYRLAYSIYSFAEMHAMIGKPPLNRDYPL